MFPTRSGIGAKLLWLALFNVATFALLAAIVASGFERVEHLLARIAGTEMTGVIENAAIGRRLTAAISLVELTSRDCREEASVGPGDEPLAASIAQIAAEVSDDALRTAIASLSTASADLLAECAGINHSRAAIHRLDRDAFAELTRLEDLISRAMIADTLAGKRTDHLDQMMSLATGYRESLLMIGKRVAEASADGDAGASDRASAIPLIDDLALRLQTLTASTPEIGRVGARLARLLAGYREAALRLESTRLRFGGALARSDHAKGAVLASMKRLDSIASGRTEVVRGEIARVAQESSEAALRVAMLVATLSLGATVLIIRRAINRPLGDILAQIAAIRSGAASPPPRGRHDEWGTIEAALAAMSAALAASNAELRVSRERLELAMQGANDGLWDWNLETDEVYFSARWKSMLGYADDEIRSSLDEARRLIDPRQVDRVFEQVDDYLAGRTPSLEIEFRMRHKRGHWVDILSRATLARGPDGGVLSPRRLVGTHVDITERKQAEAKLREAASVFTHAREGIMITAADGRILDVNEAFTRITGYERDEVVGRNPRILSSGRHDGAFYAALWCALEHDGHWQGEVWNRRKNGDQYAVMQTISAVCDPGTDTRQYVSLFSDITAIKEHEHQLEHIANYDALTALPNRVLFSDRLHQAMAHARRRGQRLAVVYLDLDGFKSINDRYGHDVGDQLLTRVAAHMKEALRDADTLARVGGDEFVAALLDQTDAEASIPLLARLVAAAARPVEIGDLVLQVSASLGVTFYPQAEDVDADQLLRQADQAMYQAKLAGKNRYHVFDADQDRNVRGHHETVERIRRALAEGEFVLHYQPKVNMRLGTVIGAEALIRWEHPEKGLLPPAAFLPVIEDHPLSVELGEWVIDSALTQIACWRAAGQPLRVSVNVGARQLQQADFVERLRALLAAHPEVQPGDLELEVLETSALEDMTRVSRVIRDCREIGVMFALDDFGTGYSSLTYLKRLPVAQIKIDRSFVGDVLDDPEDVAILEGVLGFAAAFRLQVIAEGVETVEHGALLLQLGCDLAQGYGIARAMPADALAGWAAGWRQDPSWIGLRAVDREDLPLIFAGVEHRAWVAALEGHLIGERDAPPQLDPHECRFAKWLDGEGSRRYARHPAFRALADLHRQIHLLAARMCELPAAQRSAAMLAELHGQRDALLEQLRVLGQRYRRRPGDEPIGPSPALPAADKPPHETASTR